jgi:abortive infection bacteriophage resistance protein
MKPLTLEEQVERQISKGCISGKTVIQQFLRTSSYYTVNYSYEQYIKQNGKITPFKVQDYKWLEETNDRVAKEALSLILKAERVIRNRIADEYSFYCRNNSIEYFTLESFTVDTTEFKRLKTSKQKDKFKKEFIEKCEDVYRKKKKSLNRKYIYNKLEEVPPFVIAQHLSFGHLRKFFKLLPKDLKEKIASEFNLRITEFNSISEKLNFLRNACAHGEFILDFKTLKGKLILDKTYHKYVYNKNLILNKHQISLIPILCLTSYLLRNNIKFFRSVMRNILEMTNYLQKGSINKKVLSTTLGIKCKTKTMQKHFT